VTIEIIINVAVVWVAGSVWVPARQGTRQA